MRSLIGVLIVLFSAAALAQQSSDNPSDDRRVPVYWSCGGDAWGKELCAEIGARFRDSGRVRFLSEPAWPAVVVVCSFGADGPRERERIFGSCTNNVYVAVSQKEKPQRMRRLFYSRYDGAKAGDVELRVIDALNAKYLK